MSTMFVYIYAIVILILFDIPRFSVNDLHQIQVAAPSPSSRKSVRLRRDSSTELVLSPRSLFILTYQAANSTRKTGSRVPRMTITVLVVVEDSVDSHVTVVLVSVNVHNV